MYKESGIGTEGLRLSIYNSWQEKINKEFKLLEFYSFPQPVSVLAVETVHSEAGTVKC